jgi:hypothetical protein
LPRLGKYGDGLGHGQMTGGASDPRLAGAEPPGSAVGPGGSDAGEGARPSVPSMGRILLDERSQSEPMTATVAKRKA